MKQRRRKEDGFVMVVVLVVVSLLALGAYTFTAVMMTEASATNMYGRRAQTRALADSGIEMVTALLGGIVSSTAMTITLARLDSDRQVILDMNSTGWGGAKYHAMRPETRNVSDSNFDSLAYAVDLDAMEAAFRFMVTEVEPRGKMAAAARAQAHFMKTRAAVAERN